jgi:hypothetical protein
MATGMINSVKKWYPDIPMEALEIDIQEREGYFDLRNFCSKILEHGYNLLDKYDRIIYIDPDSVMCNKCPDFFEDFELGCVQNNNPTGPEYGGTAGIYINAGLCVCTKKEVWKEIMDEYEKRNNVRWECLNHQNALNWVFHETKHKVRLLEFSDRVYGITGMEYYQDMYLVDGELYLPNAKKLGVFHSAGVYWKTGVKINFDYIKNEFAKALIIKYTHA